jgi:hypothetical protein
MARIIDLRDLPPRERGVPAGFLRHLPGSAVRRRLLRAAALLAFALVAPLLADEARPFKPKTMEAFEAYVRATDARNAAEIERGSDLLWVDSLPEASRDRAYGALARGQVEIERRETRQGSRPLACPEGLIHHWEGLVFVPAARLEDVLQVLQDYDRHAVYYAPDVARSKIESRDRDRYRVFLRFRRQKVITVVLDTEHEISYFRDAPDRAHSRSSATRIAEVDNPGKPNEKEKPRSADSGFLWGMETWWRLQEKNGGVYVQSEVVSLTRDLPAGLGWAIAPFVSAIPKESLTFTLEATRKAVLQKTAASEARRK